MNITLLSKRGGGTGAGVDSFKGRIGIVAPILDDYQASLITNDSDVDGATVKDALNTIGAVSLQDISFGESYIRETEKDIIDDGGTTYPSNAGYEIGKLKSNELLRDVTNLLQPLGTKPEVLYATKGDSFDVDRPSETTRVDVDGYIRPVAADVARIDYSDGDGVISLQKEATQLITEDVTHSYWTKSGATIDDNGGTGYPSPYLDEDGVNDYGAYKLVEDVSSGQHTIYSSAMSTSNPYATFSIFVHSNNRNIRFFNSFGTNGRDTFYDLQVGIIVSSNADNATITPLANDWWKLTQTNEMDGSLLRCRIYMTSEANVYSYQGDGTSGVLIYQPNLIEADAPRSLIKIVSGSEVTCLGDEQTGVTIIGNGSYMRNDCVTNFTNETTLLLAQHTNIIAAFDRSLTSEEITALGLAEVDFMTIIEADKEFTITVLGTGIMYWGDGESDSYDGGATNLTHTFTKQSKGVYVVGTLQRFYSTTPNVGANHNISDLPEGLQEYKNWGSNKSVGDIANLPSTLSYYSNKGYNEVSGDIANLPFNVTFFNNLGKNRINTYTSGHTFKSSTGYFVHSPDVGYGLTSTMVDNLLIDLDASGMSSGLINVSGNNAARTSASDAAVTSLEGKGITVTTN